MLELPGAVTQGRTLNEAREMIKEAVELLLESYREHAAKEMPENAVWETLSIEHFSLSSGHHSAFIIHHAFSP